MEEDREYLKLPVEDRCVHKLWKARVNGYEEAAKIFRQIDDEKSPEWGKYVGLIKKFVVDSNAPAQEKGLEAVLAFLENSAMAGRTVNDVMAGITQKCVAASKTKTKELAIQISLMYIELERHDTVIDELIKGTDSKNPKIVAACTSIITQALRTFGVKIVNVNKILKRAPAMLDDRDLSVRTEARQLIVEVFRWVGPAIRPQLASVKGTQLAELEPEFEKLKDDKPRPLRLLRSQQAKKVAASEEQRVESGELGDDADDAACCETDPYDLLDPIDVLGKLPKDFYLQLEAKKWLERKETLEILEKTLAAAPKIENADYGDLIRALKKIIVKDSNVAVIAVAIKCITGLATGLKKKFHPYAGILIPSFLEKFKEKKQNVVLALREAVDAIYPSTSLELMLEDILGALDNKNPSVKAETVSFLARSFLKCTPSILNKKMLKALVPALLNTLLSSDPIVRENAVIALGTAMKVVGEKGIGPYLGDLEASKMTKIKEYAEKVELSVKQPKKVTSSSQSTLLTSSPSKSAVQKQVTGDKAKSASNKSRKNIVTLSAGDSGDVRKLGSKLPEVLSQADVIKKANSILPPDMVSSIMSTDSDLKYTALNQLKQLIESESLNSEENCGPIVLMLLIKQQGLKDTDEQNLRLRLEIITSVGKLLPLPEESIHPAPTCLIECMVERMNCRELASEALSALCDATSLEHVSSNIIELAFLQSDPELLAESLNWVSNEVMKRGIFENAHFLIEAGKKALVQSNTLVRNAGLALIGTMHLLTGHTDSEKPKKPAINSTVNKRSVDKTRSKDIEKELMNIEYENNNEDGQQEADGEEPVTRVDISPQITDVLIAELLDKNWKVRGEAVNKFQNIVSNARYIAPNLGEAPSALSSRISDSNTKIAASAIALVETLATAIGPQCKQYTKIFLPALLRAVGDAKPWIRSAVVACLNVWSSIGGHKEFFEGEMIADALKSGTTNVRTELWAWLAEKLPKWKNIPKDELTACLPTLYANLEDRFADVRKNASDAVLGFMIHLGFGSMIYAMENMKNGGGAQVKATLEKTRALLPEKVPSKTKQQSSEKPVVRPVKLSPGSSATITKSPKSRTSLKPVAPRKKEEDVDTSPLLQVNNLKHQRIIDEQKLKTLKWNFTTPRAEFVELLKDQMIAANVNKTLIANMFNTDFKYHLRAIDALTEDLSCNHLALMSNLDLILRWMTIRFFDTNPSVLLKGLEYLNLVFSVLIEEEYNMLDNEAASFFPYLILKAGDPKDTVRNSVKAILKQIGSVYPFCKQFSYVMDGLKSKNARQRAECLEQLGWLIENYGVTVCHPTPVAALKEIAKHIADRDTSVRNAALNCVVTAYFLDGEKIMKMLSHISDKDMYLLEERIKRAAKNRPVASVKPMQTNVAAISPPSPEQATPLAAVTEHSYVEEEIEPQTEQIEINYAAASGVLSTSRSSRGSLDDLDSSPTSSCMISVKNTLDQLSPGSTPVFASPDHSCKQKMLSGQGPYGLDPNVLDEIECAPVQFQAPKLVDIDLQFLKDPATQSSVNPIQMPKVTPSLSKFTQPAAIKWELALIASGDIEKAMSAMTRIDTILNSDKRNNLSGFVDYMVSQLVHQLVILNQSTHPDLVNCYRANFSLLIKLCKFQDLCQQITEPTLYKVLEQLLILLTEHRFVTIDKHEMFLKVVNCLVIHLLDNTNKTSILCALIKMLYDTLNNPEISNHYQELVVKCLWKLNRTQPEWDSELNYVRILTEINTFLRDYPTVWWKHQEGDVPLRTIKTILHSMVKLRGIEVRDHLKNITGITTDSEMYHYIKKVIKHLKVEHVADSSSKENDVTQSLPTPSLRLSKEAQEELTDIFRMIGDVEETSEVNYNGIRRLFAFKKTYPEADLEAYLAKSGAVFQQYIKQGLATLEVQYNSSEESTKSPKSQTVGKYGTNVSVELTTTGSDAESSSQKGTFTKEAERLWSRLQHLQEQAGCHNGEERPNTTPESDKEMDSNVCNGSHRNQRDESANSEIKSIKERLEFFKNSYTT